MACFNCVYFIDWFSARACHFHYSLCADRHRRHAHIWTEFLECEFRRLRPWKCFIKVHICVWELPIDLWCGRLIYVYRIFKLTRLHVNTHNLHSHIYYTDCGNRLDTHSNSLFVYIDIVSVCLVSSRSPYPNETRKSDCRAPCAFTREELDALFSDQRSVVCVCFVYILRKCKTNR